MSYLNSLDVSASGLSAQRLRMDVIAQNIANINTTRSEDGLPYRRKVVVFEEKTGNKTFAQHLTERKGDTGSSLSGGVRGISITEDLSPYKQVFDPNHPDADENGYIQMPNIDVVAEMVNMISASRAYEANVTSINTTKSIALKALEIGR